MKFSVTNSKELVLWCGSLAMTPSYSDHKVSGLTIQKMYHI